MTDEPIQVQDRSEYKQRMLDLLEIDPARTAVVTIDMQHNYLSPGVGALPVEDDEAERVVAAAERLYGFARGLGIPVVHSYTVRRQVEIDQGFVMAGVRLMQAGISRKVSQLPHAEVSDLPDRLEGTKQAELVPSLVAEGDLHLRSKRTMDAFQYTELHMLLDRVFDVDTVILSGINTDTCVLSSTFTAANHGYQPVVAAECVASTRGKDSHAMALEMMARSIAWVATNDQIEAKLTAAGGR